MFLIAVVIVSFAGVTTACYGSRRDLPRKKASPSVFVVRTQGPQVATGMGKQLLVSWRLTDFMAIDANRKPTRFYAPLRATPNLSAEARAGRGVFFGYRQSVWILDGNDISGYQLYLDNDGDGDLRDETPTQLPPTPGERRSTATIELLGETANRVPTRIVIGVEVSNSELTINYINYRRGRVTLGDTEFEFMIKGIWGYYGMGASEIFFDIARKTPIDPQVAMTLNNRDRLVRLGGDVYTFTVDPDGSKLTLVKSSKKPDRVTAQRGAVVPDVQLVSIVGDRLSLRAFRGRPVLVDFWSISCPPCIKDFPALQSLMDADASLIVIGITPDTERILLDEFLNQHNVPWNIVVEDLDHSKVYGIFGANKFPMYVLINTDGIVECIDCSISDVANRLKR